MAVRGAQSDEEEGLEEDGVDEGGDAGDQSGVVLSGLRLFALELRTGIQAGGQGRQGEGRCGGWRSRRRRVGRRGIDRVGHCAHRHLLPSSPHENRRPRPQNTQVARGTLRRGVGDAEDPILHRRPRHLPRIVRGRIRARALPPRVCVRREQIRKGHLHHVLPRGAFDEVALAVVDLGSDDGGDGVRGDGREEGEGEELGAELVVVVFGGGIGRDGRRRSEEEKRQYYERWGGWERSGVE
mmetsp:Transcript_16593/g.34895  ORF Transcript_16593/g.34895 Transcript_16593/m.34895 type:complete len:240 (+) Transcript_16593:747-1466(+)